MEFKHAFHVFVDNFSTVYKVLVYRLIVIAIIAGLSCAVIIPTLNNILSTAQFEQLKTAFSEMWSDIVAFNLDKLHDKLTAVSEAFGEFKILVAEKSSLVAIAIVCLLIVFFIDRFLVGIGNYVTGALVNDRMTLHANSPFTITLIKNLRKALLYSIIYAPIAFLYDVVALVILWVVVSVGMKSLSMVLVKIFVFALLAIIFSVIKYMFTVDWLPSLIHSRLKNGKAIAFALSRKGKKTGSVFSNALVLKLIVFALNVAAVVFTFGAGLLLTMPATALIQICYAFVNYFDSNKLKYFVDDYTVIGPKKEAPVTREEFFKGDE